MKSVGWQAIEPKPTRLMMTNRFANVQAYEIHDERFHLRCTNVAGFRYCKKRSNLFLRGASLSPQKMAVATLGCCSYIDLSRELATIPALSCGSHKTRLAFPCGMSRTLRGYPAVAELFLNRAVKSRLRQSLPQRLFATGSVVRPAGQRFCVSMTVSFRCSQR